MKKYKEYGLVLIVVMIMLIISNMDIFLSDKVIKSKRIELDYDKEIKSNLESLEKMNGLKVSNDHLIVSKIKYRDVYNIKKEITIYKGSNEGIKEGNEVLTDEGLIGVVSKVYKDTSIVKLISNMEVSVKINNSYGILNSEDNNIVVSNISNYDEVLEGDLIYTSGIGNLKGGIYIGKVIDVGFKNGGIEKVTRIELGGNIDNINYVVVWLDD